MGIISGEVGHQHMHPCKNYKPSSSCILFGDNSGFKLVVYFPTETNEDFFSLSSVYRASNRLRAYLLISGTLRFNKFTHLSYVNIRVNLYTFIFYCYYLQSKSTLVSDMSQMDLLVALLAVSAWEQGYADR